MPLKERIQEIDLLRSIACLSVVMLHAITRILEIYEGNIEEYLYVFLTSFRLLLTFGTPVFIFLSEFLMAYSYPDKLPLGFMKKRVEFLLYPYLSMAILYAVVLIVENGLIFQQGILGSYLIYVIRNIFFGFYRHGYFIIVIFQFYFLHMFFSNKLKKIKPSYIIIGSLLINSFYLAFFNLVSYDNIPYGAEIWKGLSWGFIPAWIFYFVLGYYSGSHYKYFKKKLYDYKHVVKIIPFLTGAVVLFLFWKDIIVVESSKRFDMLLFSTSMLFIIYLIGLRLKNIPSIFSFISRYSFGIYLLHMFYLAIMQKVIGELNVVNIHPINMLFFFFGITVITSIISTYILSQWSIGKYIIGKLKKPSNKSIPTFSIKSVLSYLKS